MRSGHGGDQSQRWDQPRGGQRRERELLLGVDLNTLGTVSYTHLTLPTTPYV